jgi:hypothetical protein
MLLIALLQHLKGAAAAATVMVAAALGQMIITTMAQQQRQQAGEESLLRSLNPCECQVLVSAILGISSLLSMRLLLFSSRRAVL